MSDEKDDVEPESALVPAQNKVTVSGVVDSAASTYGDSSVLRAMVQAIPYVGSSLDTLMGAHGKQLEKRRLGEFIADVNERISALEKPGKIGDLEGLYDYTVAVMDQVVRARSKERRSHLAHLFTKQIESGHDWEDAHEANSLMASLSDFDIRVLSFCHSVPMVDSDKTRGRLVSLEKMVFPEASGIEPPALTDEFQVPKHKLRGSCAKLLSAGLLVDWGISTYGGTAFTLFEPTGLSDWFSAWIAEG